MCYLLNKNEYFFNNKKMFVKQSCFCRSLAILCIL